MTIGLHQRSTLSPYLFALMAELTTHVQEEVPYCILFADDIVLVVDESRDGVNAKFEI